MDPARLAVPDCVEGQSGTYTCVLRDEFRVVVKGSQLTSATLTLYDSNTDEIINDRTAQNVLNANDVTIDESGRLTWTVLPDDMALVSDSSLQERHVALFEFAWTDSDSRARTKVHEVWFTVNRIHNE